jgi:uncharacterized protein YbgA (DUF1722 family)
MDPVETLGIQLPLSNALDSAHRQGLVPLIALVTLLKQHLDRHPVPDWVHEQLYLHPYPKERMLLNHM